jgi:hypothetical protein
MNENIKRFLVTLPTERKSLNQTAPCLLPDSKVKQLFKGMKGNADGMCLTSRGVLRPSVNDYSNWEELQSFFKAYHSICVVSGIAGNKVMLSPDRKIDSSGRYNWVETVPMMWNLNTAKSSCRYIYENKENSQLWYEENLNDFEELVNQTVELDLKINAPVPNPNPVDDPIEVIETWVVVLEQRNYFMAMLNHYHSRNESTFFQDLQGIHYQEPESDPEIESETGLDFE